jgi:hypothetical protein
MGAPQEVTGCAATHAHGERESYPRHETQSSEEAEMRFAGLAFILAIIFGSPAFAQKVDVDYGHQEDFSKISTYKWGKNKGELSDPREDSHIKNKIDRILQLKGLRRVNAGPADMVVAYQATMRTSQEVDSYDDDPDIGLGYGWGWGLGWGWGWGDDEGYSTQVVNINKGDLLVDFVDPVNKKIILRGYSTGAFHLDPIKEDQQLSKALNKMLKNFPPKEKTKRS